MRCIGFVIAIDRILSVGALLVPALVHTSPRNQGLRADSSESSFRPLTSKEADTEPVLTSRNPVLSFPGGGIYFWWQAGAITALQENYDLSSVDFVGASAGALAATLAACDADMDRAMALALELCEVNEVRSRPLKLGGVWGAMVEDWLNDLLPEDADVICRDRVHLLVLGLWPRPLKRQTLSNFSSKEDLVKSCMASVHIPYFMNRRFSARHRGHRYVDGSFMAGRKTLSLGESRPTVYLDYYDDAAMEGSRGKFLSLTNREGLLLMRERGYEHVQGMIAEGKLDSLDKAGLCLA